MSAPRKFESKAAAKTAWEADRRAWQQTYEQMTADFLNAMTATIAHVNDADDDSAKHLMAAVKIHLPVPDGGWPACEGCSGCCDEVAWPCQTFTALAQGIGLPTLPDPDTDAPKFTDYWRDPYVTVTFAHLTSAQAVHEGAPRYYAPQEQGTFTLAEATRVKSRLIHSSMARVDALR